MKKLSLIALSTMTAITTLGTVPPSALAGTSAYVSGGLLDGGLEKCLQDAEKAATKAGFTESQETVLDDGKKAGDFHADQKGSTLHMTFRCDPPNGVWSIAVSGIDNEETFNGFNKVMEAFE
jgi:hypothetical protein